MNARLVASAILVAAAFPLSSSATGVTIVDTCGSSVSGNITGSSNIAVDPSGNLTVNGFGGAGFSMGIGQCDAAAANERPTCILIASPQAIEPGGTVSLFAKCRTPSAISTYTWTGPTAPAAPAPGPSSSFSATFPNPGVYSFAVAGTNANGTGNASPQVNVLVGSAASATTGPACTVTLSPNLIMQNTASRFKVSCQPEAASYSWDAPETGAPAAAGVSGGLTFPAPGSFTYKVRGNSAAGTAGPKASATVTVISDGSCVPGPYWAEAALPLSAFSQDAAMPPNATVAWSFTVAPGAYSQMTFQYHTAYNYYWFPASGVISVSKCRGDFNVPAQCTTPFSNQYWSQIFPAVGHPYAANSNYCVLEPNTTYYLNIKVLDCTGSPSGYCGYRIYRYR